MTTCSFALYTFPVMLLMVLTYLGDHPSPVEKASRVPPSRHGAGGNLNNMMRTSISFGGARVLPARPSTCYLQGRVRKELLSSGRWCCGLHAYGRAAPVAFEQRTCQAAGGDEFRLRAQRIWIVHRAVGCTLKVNGPCAGGAPCNGPSPLASSCSQRGRAEPTRTAGGH